MLKIIEILHNNAEKKTPQNRYNPERLTKKIKKLDEQTDNWESTNIRHLVYKNYDEFIEQNIKNKQRRELNKKWHKDLKGAFGVAKLCNIADMQTGPFISTKDYEIICKDEKMIEKIHIMTEETEILEANI